MPDLQKAVVAYASKKVHLWVSKLQIHSFSSSPPVRQRPSVHPSTYLAPSFLIPTPANTFLTFAPMALLRLALFEFFELLLELVPTVLAFTVVLGGWYPPQFMAM